MTDKCLGLSPKPNLHNQTDIGFGLKSISDPNVCIVIKLDLIKSEEKCRQIVPFPCQKIIIDGEESIMTGSKAGPTAPLFASVSASATKTGTQTTGVFDPTTIPGSPIAGPGGDGQIGGGGGGVSGGGGSTQSSAAPANGSNTPGLSASRSDSGAPLGAIIGGAVGGLVVLVGLIALIVILRRKKRGRNEYEVRLQSEPDIVAEPKDAKHKRRLASGSPGASPTAVTAAAVAGRGDSAVMIDMVERSFRSESAASGVYSMPIQTQAQGQGQKHAQPQIQTAMISPAPTTSLSGGGYTPGRSVAAPIEYTPRSTYISPTSSPVNATAGAATDTIGSRTMPGSTSGAGAIGQPILPPAALERQGTERHSGYIDLIPVEETPRIPHSTLGDGNSSAGRSAEEQGLLQSGGASGKDVVGTGKTGQQHQEQGRKVEEDEESEIDEDEIKYL
ncbi:hypothetical protein BG011_009445 [Mortierella polycephala]|uniref:Mid2 domain-containing protein n=1 Tax=Mortierella polycephala TaxID=41804 RepID=A0A9P6TW60_9FUNG|nr:hypothetical protein BG011_009445 [Mortierella polycephala]